MYPKIVRIKVKDKSYPYLRLVESYREGRKVKQRTLANLGNLNALKKKRKIDSLIHSLIKISQKEYFRLDELKSKKSFRYADAFLIRTSWLTVKDTLKTHQVATVILATTSDEILKIRKGVNAEPKHLEIYKSLKISSGVMKPVKTWHGI